MRQYPARSSRLLRRGPEFVIVSLVFNGRVVLFSVLLKLRLLDAICEYSGKHM